MQGTVSVSPFRCHPWSEHERMVEQITEGTCSEEICGFQRHGQRIPAASTIAARSIFVVLQKQEISEVKLGKIKTALAAVLQDETHLQVASPTKNLQPTRHADRPIPCTAAQRQRTVGARCVRCPGGRNERKPLRTGVRLLLATGSRRSVGAFVATRKVRAV